MQDDYETVQIAHTLSAVNKRLNKWAAECINKIITQKRIIDVLFIVCEQVEIVNSRKYAGKNRDYLIISNMFRKGIISKDLRKNLGAP